MAQTPTISNNYHACQRRLCNATKQVVQELFEVVQAGTSPTSVNCSDSKLFSLMQSNQSAGSSTNQMFSTCFNIVLFLFVHFVYSISSINFFFFYIRLSSSSGSKLILSARMDWA